MHKTFLIQHKPKRRISHDEEKPDMFFCSDNFFLYMTKIVNWDKAEREKRIKKGELRKQGRAKGERRNMKNQTQIELPIKMNLRANV